MELEIKKHTKEIFCIQKKGDDKKLRCYNTEAEAEAALKDVEREQKALSEKEKK